MILDLEVFVFFLLMCLSFLVAKQNTRKRYASILAEAIGLPLGLSLVVGLVSYQIYLETGCFLFAPEFASLFNQEVVS